MSEILNEIIQRYNAVIQEGQNVGFRHISNRFMNSVGLPEGSLQVIMKPIEEIFPENKYVNYIPLDPMQAPAADKLTYPRVTDNGTGEPGQVGSNYRRVIDVDVQPVEYRVTRDKSLIRISHYENERMELAASRGNIGAALNMFALKLRAAYRDSAKVRDRYLSRGDSSLGILGLLNSPDVIVLNLTAPFPSVTNPESNLVVLNEAVSEISRKTNGAITPTTLLFNPSDFTFLRNQRLNDTDNTVLRFFNSNQEMITLENGEVTPFEISHSAQLENCFGTGNHAFHLLSRHSDNVCQALPMPLTPRSAVTTTEGYEVPLDADYTGGQLKQPYSQLVVRYSRD